MQVVYSLVLISFDSHDLPNNKIKASKTLEHCSRDILKFGFLKGLVIVSQPHFVCGFSRKIFLKLNSIN